jgi:hypothetical protein
MSEAVLYQGGMFRIGGSGGWRKEPRLVDLQAELVHTREELATLRATTAQVISAILGELHSGSVPVASEIQKLANLVESPQETVDDALAADAEAIDACNEESMAYLDRRFRWFPSGRRDS